MQQYSSPLLTYHTATVSISNPVIRVLNFGDQEFRYWRRNAGSTEALHAGTTRQDSKRLPGKQL
jgi:hypothetical protein